MSIFPLFARNKKSVVKHKTAELAKDRLKLLFELERRGRGRRQPAYLPALKKELLEVIAKHTKVDVAVLKLQLQRQENQDVLEVKLELPDTDGD